MGNGVDPSIENLQRSLVLNRKLLSLIQIPGSERDVARFVVDMLFEEFPQYRVSCTNLCPDNTVHIFYSRQPEGMRALSGLSAPFPDSPFVRNLHEMRISVIDDIRLHPDTESIAQEMQATLGTLARLDFPFEKKENGEIGLITLSHLEPLRWSAHTIQLISEIVELVHLMFREARTRERLKQSETLFQQFTENMPLVFWVVEPVEGVQNQKIVYVSPAYEEVWGLSVESLIADPASFIRAIHPEDRERIAGAMALPRSGPYEQTYRVVRPDGSVRWVRDRGNPIFNETGKMIRNLGIAEDITALKLAQQKLEATQAQVISNAKFAALGEMAGGIAHEINNPLAVISALAQQMRELQSLGLLAPKAISESIDSIDKMANCIAGIVKGLRTFSRQTDRDPLLSADVCGILRETLALCEAKIQQANADFKLKTPEFSVRLKCRASEISQVILNLINNALDAVADAAEKSITLCAEVIGREVLLTVEDSGPGVKAELRESIFQPFFTTKAVGKGTGLGLSISKGIVEAHGGKLYLDNSSKKTRFVVRLPLEA